MCSLRSFSNNLADGGPAICPPNTMLNFAANRSWFARQQQAKRACASRLLFASLPWKEKKKDRRFSTIKRKSDLQPGFRRMLDGCGMRSRRRLWLNKINEANFSIQAFRSNNYSSLCFLCILNLHRNEGSLLKLFVNTWTNETFFDITGNPWRKPHA